MFFCCRGLLQLILLDGIYQIYTTFEWIVSMLSKIFITHGLPLSLRTDNWPRLAVNVYELLGGRRNWTQTNHTLMATGQWWILKCLCIAQAEGRHWKSEMDNFLMILIVPNILLLGLACQNCCLEDASGPNYPSPRVQHPRWDARSWQWEKRKREGVCRLPKECMWRWNSRRW